MSNKFPRLKFAELRSDIAESLAATYQRLGYLSGRLSATARAIMVISLGIKAPVPSLFEAGFAS